MGFFNKPFRVKSNTQMKGSINIRYISAYYYILGDPDPSHEH